MKIVITSKNTEIDSFVYNYLPDYIYDLFLSTVDLDRLNIFDKELKINSFNLLSRLLKSLSISKISNFGYDISINKNIRYNGRYAINYLNFITYGNRSIKGYPIIRDIFNYIANNIYDIYEKYERGD